jgi:hypothetical protein
MMNVWYVPVYKMRIFYLNFYFLSKIGGVILYSQMKKDEHGETIAVIFGNGNSWEVWLASNLTYP